ncbi:hypothetical protein [Palleronia caenipelagi]|uniref:Uncharacterized protein n=1 Tax=Palleronia caenipelagi TaxID=2489174 RepID=A0A547Q778_9RHOB|nr:hypothetical protein [Palleronia caenipelagi]TRD22236.1 hypothetical protein FEV53_05810 [Palleronia caenipelagi]
MAFTTGIPGERVEKIMSFTRPEFENGLRRLTGGRLLSNGDGYDLSQAAGAPVRCTFEPQPDAQLSPLMRLPRARVVLDMTGLDDAARIAFLRRFETTFQRGGG